MIHTHLNKQELRGSLNKLMHMYLPSSNNPRFTNRLLISKITAPHTMNISFDEKDSIRCHNIKNNLQQIKNKNKGQSMKLNLVKRSAAFANIQISLSARYSKQRDQINCQQAPQTERVKILHMNTLDKWKALNATCRHRQKNTISQQKKIQKQVRMSISRLLQQSHDRQTFDYITKFYKKPIEKQLSLKKSKRQSKNISQILNVTQYRPKTDGKNRFSKTIQPRCRCHKKTPNTAVNRLNNTSYQLKRKQINLQSELKPKTSVLSQRKTIVLSLPQNWTVDSWNTQSKTLQEGPNGIQQGIFHQ